MGEYRDGVKWGQLDVAAGKPCKYRERPTHSFMQMGYFDGYAEAQNRYVKTAMMKSNRELPFFLRDERAEFEKHGRKSSSGRRARLYIAAAKDEMRRRRMTVEPGPEPDEKLEVILKLFGEL